MNSLGLPDLGGNDTERDKRIAGKIRGFFQRQTLKKENLAENPFLRQQIGKAWDALQKPIRLKDGWSLLLQPQSVSLSALSEESETVGLVAEVVGKPVLVAGPAAPTGLQALPAFSISDAPVDKGFHISLQTELPFDRLGEELTNRLKGKSYTAAGNTFSVKKVRVYGSGDSLVVGATLSGDIRGTVYLAGTPRYDPSSQEFSLGNLDYTLETRQALVRAADWMMHSDLRDAIAKKAAWNATDRIAQAKADLTTALNRTLNTQVSIRGTIESVRPSAIGFTQTGLSVFLEAAGSVEINVM